MSADAGGTRAETIARITGPDEAARARARARLDDLTKPPGSLGRLEDLAASLAAITGRLDPPLRRKVVFTLAADHGVAAEGVSAYPQEVTRQMVLNFLRGGAAINVLARGAGAEVIVADLGVAGAIEIPPGATPRFRDRKIRPGTANMARGPAMSRGEAERAVETGMRLVEEESREGLDLVATGEMGIGNTTAAAAIAAVLGGIEPARAVGRGTGIDEAALERKIAVIRRSIEVNRPDPADPLDTLAKVGGLEIAGLCGVILGCAARRIPVIVDGFISSAACLAAVRFAPVVRDLVIASHLSAERGHALMLETMGLKPLVDFDLRLGEGTGACLVFSLVEAAARVMNEMATFSSASVSRRLRDA